MVCVIRLLTAHKIANSELTALCTSFVLLNSQLTPALAMATIKVFVILACSLTCLGIRYNLEAERSISTGTIMSRTSASGDKTVYLLDDDYLMFYLHANSSCNVAVHDVRYSNDGESDTIELLLNRTKIGSFRTRAASRWGRLWNVFEDSGVVGNPVFLSAGQNYSLKLVARRADRYGVEIDQISLDSSCHLVISAELPKIVSPMIIIMSSIASTLVTALLL